MTDQHIIEIMARAARDSDLGGRPLPATRPPYRAIAHAAHAALRAAGYAVVPKTASDNMLEVGTEEFWDRWTAALDANRDARSDPHYRGVSTSQFLPAVWRAMIEAAEQPPTGAADG